MNTLSSIKNMYKVYELLPTQDSSKQLILEPLSCVLKLSLLQYKNKGTKISVSNNSVKFNEPSMIQGLTRRLTGDSRHDLHNICHPLMKCLEWYPLSEDVNAFFYQECVKGLEILKSSYESNSIINHTIDHYIGLLQGKEFEPIEDTAVTGGLKNMWTERELLILQTMLKHILSLDDDIDKEMYLDVLEHLLSMKEQKVNYYIQSISTSYS
tara:strand:+ start:32299 stop:32931 length:633 start_codon:yes stop_codon:yes gene_type:complete